MVVEMTGYSKIDTLFKRNENFEITDEFRRPELGIINSWRMIEKLDGCVWKQTSIRMADGTRKEISKIKPGDYVLGYDGVSAIPTKVLAVTVKPKAGKWLKIKSARNKLGKGPSHNQIICTTDHKIWCPDLGYVEAENLKIGDQTLSSRSDLSLTPLVRSVLMGKLIGDGSLAFNERAETAFVAFGHKEEHECLVDWTIRGLGDLGSESKYFATSGYGTKMVRSRSKSNNGIYNTFRGMINEAGQKTFPKEFINIMSPIALAFWYMDDGSLNHHEDQEDRANLATNGFDLDSCNNLAAALNIYNIGCNVKDYSKGWQIEMNAEDAEKFFLIVAPYIPPFLQYKLPARYRGHPGWLPEHSQMSYHNVCLPQTITSIEYSGVHERWDLTTDTGNFFTTGFLIHNSNTRLATDGNDIVWGGRTDRAQHSEAVTEYMNTLVEKVRDKLFTMHSEHNLSTLTLCLYGELIGPKIQSGGRYRSDLDFVLFDVKVDKYWLDEEKVTEIARSLDISRAPELREASIQRIIDDVRRGFVSTIAQDKAYLAEGIIAKPTYPLYDSKGNRIMFKLKTRDFEKVADDFGY